MRIIIQAFMAIVVCATALYVYQYHGTQIKQILFPDNETYVVYLGHTALRVTAADTPEERQQGLSGVPSLGDFEGKLFIFDSPGKYGFWMEDMLFPIDIIWFNENLQVIHIEQNVKPNTYPKVFAPDTPARFVLETNAYFVDSLKIKLGDRLNLPAKLIPEDLKERLKN